MGRSKSAAKALANPGLKQQTPNEKMKTDLHLLSDRHRWEYLFSLNVCPKSPTK
jgi:hypothetical protein